jgi:hypothetical protein
MVLTFVKEMEKLQAKGELAEGELRELEMDVTGKVGYFVFWHIVIGLISAVD